MAAVLLQGSYMTIHITPEPEFSYVSFETNVPLSSYEELIRRVVKTFQPGKFIVTLFANRVSVGPTFCEVITKVEMFGLKMWSLFQKSAASKTPKELKNLSKIDNEWRQLTSDLCYVSNYDMTVAFYSKFPSWGSWEARGFLAVGTRRPSSARRSISLFDNSSSRLYDNRFTPAYYYVSLLLTLFIQKFALFLTLHYISLHDATPSHHFAWRWLRISWTVYCTDIAASEIVFFHLPVL